MDLQPLRNCGMRNAECGMNPMRNVECGVRNVRTSVVWHDLALSIPHSAFRTPHLRVGHGWLG